MRYIRDTILIHVGDIVGTFGCFGSSESLQSIYHGQGAQLICERHVQNVRVKYRLVISKVPALCGDRDRVMERGRVISNKLPSRT